MDLNKETKPHTVIDIMTLLKTKFNKSSHHITKEYPKMIFLVRDEREKDLNTWPITDVTLKCTCTPRNFPSNSWTSVLPLLVDICIMKIWAESQYKSFAKNMELWFLQAELRIKHENGKKKNMSKWYRVH